MKCRKCRKIITGKYIQADGYFYHPECFVCEKCNKIIEGPYQLHKGKPFHPACYKEKTGLVCKKCGKLLADRWIEYEGAKYHPHCLKFTCAICGETIMGEYTYDKDGKYHKRCFIERNSLRCSICERPIVGKYIKDNWGNRSHLSHGSEGVHTCDYCGRIVSYPTSNGGYKYSDGRIVCGICKLTAVENDGRIRDSLNRVIRILSSAPASIRDIPPRIPVQLVDRANLRRLGGSRLTEYGEGITVSKVTYRDKTRIKTDYRIYILFGIPRLEFEAVLAHELLHAWLIENHSTLSKKETEGFCDLGSALIYQADGSKLAEMLLKRMEERTDRIYGKGYRKMNAKLKKLGWKRLKWFSTHQ
jgi:hypothetical protein